MRTLFSNQFPIKAGSKVSSPAERDKITVRFSAAELGNLKSKNKLHKGGV